MTRESLLVQELDQNWRPVFEEKDEAGFGYHGSIPLKHLGELLHEKGSGALPKQRIEYLLHEADRNKDKMIDYEEFKSLITEQKREKVELGVMRRMVRGAANTVLPRAMVAERELEYESARDCKPPPLFMIIVSAVELAVFIYYAVALAPLLGPVTMYGPFPVDSPLVYSPVRRKEAWRYVSYMLIHAGWIHVTVNLLFQLAVGIPLEMVHKFWRIGLIYFCGVLAGLLGSSFADSGSYLAGASAGVYALIAAHLSNVIMNWAEMGRGVGLSGPIRLGAVLTFGLLDIGVAVYERHFAEHEAGRPRTGYAAHLSGAITGLLIGVIVLRNLDKKFWEKILWWIVLAIFILLCVAAIIFNIFYPGFPVQEV